MSDPNASGLTVHEHDYWCTECQAGFFSCSFECADHNSDPKNNGHPVYGSHDVDMMGRPKPGASPLFTSVSSIPQHELEDGL